MLEHFFIYKKWREMVNVVNLQIIWHPGSPCHICLLLKKNIVFIRLITSQTQLNDIKHQYHIVAFFKQKPFFQASKVWLYTSQAACRFHKKTMARTSLLPKKRTCQLNFRPLLGPSIMRLTPGAYFFCVNDSLT